ncbi:MAG TPA: hypothetical protein VK126_06445 [Nitrososphaerales archaeon]|nr:hypothetical protein [Nitrososphaerales archaeon]
MNRAQKLRWYSEQLIADAVADEKSGNSGTAISHYLQAAEILLLLAKVEESYTPWKIYTDNAAMCQKKARALIALGPTEQPVPQQTAPTGRPALS